MATKVFFSRELGDFVVDERCVCGHMKRDHGSKLIHISAERMVRLPNDGNCCKGKCDCVKFRWAGWVTASEFEATELRKRCKKSRT